MKEAHGLDIITTEGILSTRQSKEVVDYLLKKVESYDNITLAGFERAVILTKSFIIALALIERHISVEFAATAAQLEVIQQISKWGEVEDSHDISREDLKRNLGAIICALI